MELKFTKTQQAILDVLKDGEPHPRRELWACIPDAEEMARDNPDYPRVATNEYLKAVRAKLRIAGQDIICQCVGRSLCYRWIRLLRPNGVPDPSL